MSKLTLQSLKADLVSIRETITGLKAEISSDKNTLDDILASLDNLQKEVDSDEPESDVNFAVIGLVDLPPMGGMALPHGVCMHGIVRSESSSPFHADHVELLNCLADEKYPNHKGVQVISFYPLSI